ncbi:SusC/RagA family TonB-linked outer membrane protein [Chitinophaga alhagiae]|uniref:SusC/RagA family TonB-linked outer membrane protein n=2 Tax=Chitinophaga alhagiae TaxID=2203219 RepID=A0ABN5M0P2_9BACT|nr:SusC/RagA family TonB-linked outer membrane protein [Chitinophaga alhagiae]
MGQANLSGKINVNFKNTPLKEALRTITRQAGTVFVYTSNDAAFQAPVTYSANAESVENVIKKILAPQQLQFRVMEGKVLIEKARPVPQQEKPLNITGRVVDAENGQPMPGVSVSVKGTGLGASTDAEGIYHLKGVQPGATLAFSLLGYARQEQPLNGRGVLNVNMRVSASELSETVVIGYGTQKRSDLTGSVGSVNVNDMNKAPVASFDEALAGRVAGVQVSSTEGQPGAGITISIRGNNSLTQDNSPLYVIDGFPIESPDNNMINPDDIESIDVLKDASATAIYGARGANGVIIITTKRGKTGAPVISYNGRYGWMENIQRIPVMNAYEFVKLQQEINVGDLDETYLANGVTVDDYKNVESINWQSKLYRVAPQQNHSISMRGGSERTKYAVSGQALDQQGTIINSAFKRYQAKVSLDQQINDQLKVGGNVTYTNTKTTGTTPSAPSLSSMNNLLYSAWGYRPTGPINSSKPINENFEDELIDDMVNSGTDYRINPFLSAENEYRLRNVDNLVANAFGEYTIIPGLRLRVSGGLNKTTQRNDAFNNSKTRSGNPYTVYKVNGSIMYYETTNWLNENTLTYDKKFNKYHRLNAVAGFTAQGNHYSVHGMSANQLPNESLGLNGLSQGVPQPVTSRESEWALASMLARVNYVYRDKYFLTASFRSDGSSKFRADNQWSYFPSGAVAWQISKEKFMQEIKFISNAKLRASWGITGNNRVGDYATYALLDFGVRNSYYSFANELQQSAIPTSMASIDLKWENTSQTDVGLDVAFLKSRISLGLDYYRKVTSDLLLNARLPPTVGYGTAYKNVGKTSNEGMEITLNTRNVETKDFTWSTNFNISFNRSKVLALTQNQEALTSNMGWDSWYSSVALYIAKIGQPVGQFYGYIWDGVYGYNDFDALPNGGYLLKEGIPTNGNTRAAIKPGDIRYRDLNGDGVVNVSDQTVIGRGFPVHVGGFSNNFTYRGFDLNIFFQWSYGNQVMNANRINFENGNKTYLNQYKTFENRWTPENTTSNIPRAGGQYGYVYSTRTLEDASFLRLKTVSLGYNVPGALLRRARIKSLRVFAAAQNLVTWTKYTGSDPEVAIGYTALTPGFDYSSYPRARTATIGVNLGL